MTLPDFLPGEIVRWQVPQQVNGVTFMGMPTHQFVKFLGWFEDYAVIEDAVGGRTVTDAERIERIFAA